MPEAVLASVAPQWAHAFLSAVFFFTTFFFTGFFLRTTLLLVPGAWRIVGSSEGTFAGGGAFFLLSFLTMKVEAASNTVPTTAAMSVPMLADLEESSSSSSSSSAPRRSAASSSASFVRRASSSSSVRSGSSISSSANGLVVAWDMFKDALDVKAKSVRSRGRVARDTCQVNPEPRSTADFIQKEVAFSMRVNMWGSAQPDGERGCWGIDQRVSGQERARHVQGPCQGVEGAYGVEELGCSRGGGQNGRGGSERRTCVVVADRRGLSLGIRGDDRRRRIATERRE